MAGLIGGLGDLAANAGGEAIAFGLGFALGRALEPAGVELSQEAWKVAPIRAPDALVLAEGVAQGQVDPDDAAGWAAEHGYGPSQFKALVDIANTGPALGYAFQAWRRGKLTDEEFTTALHRTGLEQQWNTAIEALKDELLDPGALATAIHRGIIAGQGLLLQEPPTGPGNIPQVPQSTIDGVQEAAGHGYTPERLRVLIGNTGLPLPLGEMLQLLNRGHVTEDDVKRSIAQSNVRNEYMDAAMFLRRRLVTPHEYEEGALRGVITRAEADAGAALSGMEPADAQFLFEIMGRPLPVHGITTGLARDGQYGGTYADVPQPYQDAIRRSNIRPEYARLAYANRYTLPSAFVLRTLAQSGELGHDEVHKLLLEIGWPPELVDKVAKLWAGSPAAAVDKHVQKAQTQLWNTLHKSVVDTLTTDTEAGPYLTAAGVPEAAHADVLATWRHEQELIRSTLTPAQIKKAVGGKLFTTDEAVQLLLRHGYDQADANTFLAE